MPLIFAWELLLLFHIKFQNEFFNLGWFLAWNPQISVQINLFWVKSTFIWAFFVVARAVPLESESEIDKKPKFTSIWHDKFSIQKNGVIMCQTVYNIQVTVR